MKILFILPEYLPNSGGGIATFYNYLTPELIEQGHQVDVFVCSIFTDKQLAYKANGVAVKFLNHYLIKQNLQKFSHYSSTPELQIHLACAHTAWEEVDGGYGYDLVEVTDWGMLFAPWIVSENGPPTIVQLHASIGQIDFLDPQLDTQTQSTLCRLIEIGLLPFADELQTNSQSNAQYWQQLINRNIHCIPPSINITNVPQSYTNTVNGLAVGRVQYWKGPTVLCEALRLLNENAPNIDWIGRDTVYRDSESSMSTYLAKKYSDIWGKKVHPIGTFLPEETRKLQAKAKFIIVPSIWDVFNYTCAEGMALGKVVLCSQGAGASSLIIDGVNGLTFKADDAHSMADSLETVMSWSDAKIEEVGKAAQETVIKILNPQLIAQKRIETYRNLVKRGKYPVKPNQWIIKAVLPTEKLEKPLAFLDHFPLRDLIYYAARRSMNKVFNKRQ